MAMTQESESEVPTICTICQANDLSISSCSQPGSDVFLREIPELNGENHGKIWGNGTPNDWRL